MTIQNKLIIIVITLAVAIALYLRFKDGIAPFLNEAGKNIGGSFKGGLDAFYKSIGLGEQTVTTQHGTITGGAPDPLGAIPDAGKQGSGLVIGEADPDFLNEKAKDGSNIASYTQDSKGNTIIKDKDGNIIQIDQKTSLDNSKRDIFGNIIPASNEAFADTGNTPVFDSKGVPTGLKAGAVYVSGFGYMSQKQYEEYLAKQTKGAIQVDSKSLDIHNVVLNTITPSSTTTTNKTKSKSIPTQPTTFTINGGKFTNVLGFVGGKTTQGNNIVDTLSEVLKLNPKLSASQARDALNEFKGLTPEQFLKVNSDVKNLSNAGKEKIPNVALNASRGLSGLSPEEISSMLVRHVV